MPPAAAIVDASVTRRSIGRVGDEVRPAAVVLGHRDDLQTLGSVAAVEAVAVVGLESLSPNAATISRMRSGRKLKQMIASPERTVASWSPTIVGLMNSSFSSRA